MGKDFVYMDVNTNKASENINMIFPDWNKDDERVCVFSPHDDDALIGAGYAMEAARRNGAEVYVLIFCSGNAGYSHARQKDKIVEVRREETLTAYRQIGIPGENILRFDYSDFSALQNIGWKLNSGEEGSFRKVVTALRKMEATRVLVPNHYREHIDHYAVSLSGSYDSPQAGDPVTVDWGKPHTVRNVLEYSVWADLSPEDALVCGRDAKLRANRIIAVSRETEDMIQTGISCYVSQGEIIKNLIESRKERLCNNGTYIETYISFDPRPKLDFKPYRELMEKMV